MQKTILIIVGMSVGIGVLTGCSSDTHLTTPQEKKAFLGGPMPPDARKKFEEARRKFAESRAAAIDKAKAAASGSK
jgi:hypothetical protein